MDILRQFRNYVLEPDFEIHILKDKVNIVNYNKIKDISNKKITITYAEGEVTIIGERLAISKLLNDEILITGMIKNIELE